MLRMSKRSTGVAVACLFAFAAHAGFAGSASAATAAVQPKETVTGDSATRQRLLQIPLSFEANQGQVDSSVKFLSRGDGYALFLTAKDAVFELSKKSGPGNTPSVMRMRFVGANGSAPVSGVDKLSGTANYFVGSDPRKWHAGVPTYGKVAYRGIFPGIDAIFYGNQRELEYDFVVAPGADPGRIDMEFTGTMPKLDVSGNVLLSLDGDDVLLRKPVLYQGEGSERKPVGGGYVVEGHRVHMQVGAYDRSKPLVIDPGVSYLTYLGGSTGKGSNVGTTSISCRPNACDVGAPEGQGLALDSDGNVYVTGQTWAVDFPTQNPYQSSNKSAYQWTAYVTKLNSGGTRAVYSTYLGGSVNDAAYAITVDAAGSAYVVGVTSSGDFPTTVGSYEPACPIQFAGPPVQTYCQSGQGSFLTKLSPDGQSLVYSTYLAIQAFAVPVNSVAIDAQGRAYVSGYTTAMCSASTLGTCFPTTANALISSDLFNQTLNPQTIQPGMAFLSVFSADGSSLLYSTLFGDAAPALHGNYGDHTASWTKASGVAVDPSGNFYLAGFTADRNIPVTAGAYQSTWSAAPNTYRSYVAKFSPVDSAGGPQLVYSTYLGARNTTLNSGDEIVGIAVDASGSAYVNGFTQNWDFPTTSGAYSTTCAAPGNYCYNAAFLSKLAPDGSALTWSTFVGYNDSVNGYNGILAMVPPSLDTRGNVYVEVQTSQGYPVLNPVHTPGVGAVALGITKFDPTGSKRFFSTLLGGTTGGAIGSTQYPAGIAVDAQGDIYVAGMTNRGDLPATAGSFQTTFPLNSQNWAGFIAKLDPFFIVPTTLVITPTSVNVGQPVTFTGTVVGGLNGTPTGTVNFMYFKEGWKLLGSGTLNAQGVATFTSSTLAAGSYDVSAIYQGDDTFRTSTSNSQNLTVGLATQTITFNALPNVTYGAAPITLAATASSGLPISYGVTGPATLNGSTLTITGAGTVSITASQDGNGNYQAAAPVIRTLTVAPATVTLTATSASIGFGQAIPTLTYTTSGFVNGDTSAVLSGAPQETTTATSTSPAGTYPITILQGTLAATNYVFAFVNGTLTISGGATQTITFGALPNVTYGVAPITLSASASSGLPVTYAVAGPATLSGSTLTVTGVGTVNVTASQAGNANYGAATPVSRSFTVAPATLTVTATNTSVGFGQAIPTFSYTTTGFVNGDTSAVLSGTPLETTTATSTSPAGTYPITIAKGTLAAANYTFAFVNGTLTIGGGATQTVTFGALPNVTYGAAPITLTATASSSLPVAYAVTGPATLSGSTLTVTGVGTVNVTASQAGNANYGAAAPVTRSFTVAPATLTVTATSASIGFGQAIPAFTYTATGFVNGDTSAVLSGTPLETTTATSSSPAGTYPINIAQGTLAAANYMFSFVNGTLTINGGATQTITFGALPNVTYGVAPTTLAATASSGLPVTYAVTGPATLSGSTLTVTGVGTVNVTASQAGNANYGAATPVTRSFTVAPATLTVTATSAAIAFGQTIPPFTYTATGFVNGDTSAVLSGTPQETTTATSTSPAGSYPIAIAKGTLTAANYTFTFVNGTLTITGGQATQTITFGALPNVTYGAAPITLGASASSGLPVTYAIIGPATLSGSTLTVTGVGTVSVTASQAGNASYSAATPVTRSFTVAPATLTVSATNAIIASGQPIPAFTYTVGGFVNGDTSSVLSGTPQETTTATSSSPPGSYPIVIAKGTLAAANYTFAFVNGTLTLTGGAAAQTITFDAIPAQLVGVTINLSASASSGLPVSFASLSPGVCSVAGTTAKMLTVGACSIQATQAGNASYLAAVPVTRTFSSMSPPVARFTIDPDPPYEAVVAGQWAFFSIDVRSVDRFKGTVKLACSGGPAGSQCNVEPGTVYLNGRAFAFGWIHVPKTAASGSYPVTFTGTSGSVSITATTQLRVK